MISSRYIIMLINNYNDVIYWINFLENWNKTNNKHYITFSNSITKGNGNMSLKKLYHYKFMLNKQIIKNKNKFLNYYKNNKKIIVNKVFK